MCAVKLPIKAEDLPLSTLTKIRNQIKRDVPVGFNWNKDQCEIEEMPFVGPRGRGLSGWGEPANCPVIQAEYGAARLQLGSLGGGNHFIEVQKDKNDNIWIMIHSGSRNLGKKTADHYNKIAVSLNQKWFSTIPKEHQLAFLPIDSDEGKAYKREMEYCVDFAFANREKMMKACIYAFNRHTDVSDTDYSKLINIAHNYAAWENHFGKNVIVHRKGATRAYKNEIGIIPGSQGTSSYIVEGLGYPESFKSCSHGAGRKMGRKAAKSSLSVSKEEKRMKNILADTVTRENIDECPGAYKDINKVMEYQKDLVDIICTLTPIMVVKGN